MSTINNLNNQPFFFSTTTTTNLRCITTTTTTNIHHLLQPSFDHPTTTALPNDDDSVEMPHHQHMPFWWHMLRTTCHINGRATSSRQWRHLSLSLFTSIQVSHMTPLPLSFSHTGNRGHIAVSDVATNNRWTIMTFHIQHQRTMDNVEVSNMNTFPLSFFHTRSRGHITVSDMVNNNRWTTTMINGRQC